MTLAHELLSQAKLHARIDTDDDATRRSTLEAAQGDVLAVAVAGNRVGGWAQLHGHCSGTGALREIYARTKLRQFSGRGYAPIWGLGQGTGVIPSLSLLTQFFDLMRAQRACARAN